MSKTAVILAGGFGKRLTPYTADTPKSLLPIQGTPLLDRILSKLAAEGFERIILALHHLAGSIRTFCKDGSKWNVSIEYSEESKPLGTIGPLKLISNLPPNFLIMNSDILTDMDLRQFYTRHTNEKNLFTIAYSEQQQEIPYGVLQIQAQKLTGFVEKPILQHAINMGIYMANREILKYIPNDTFFGLNDLVRTLLQSNQTVDLAAHQGHWMDVGTLETYERTQCRSL